MKRLLLALCLPAVLWAAESYYPSGTLRRFEAERPRTSLPEAEAVETFLKVHFGGMPAGFAWRLDDVTRDNTHAHYRYLLHFQSRRVLGGILKLHYNRDGWIQYASSSWESPVVPVLPEDTETHRMKIEAQIRVAYQGRYGTRATQVQLEPVVWIDPQGIKAVAAFEVILTGERQGVHRRFAVDERTGDLLEERRWLRFDSANVYLSSPLGSLSSETLVTPDVTNALHNPFLYVRMEEQAGSSYNLIDVQDSDYSTLGSFSTSPDNYEYTCTSGAASCPNLGFDAVNVYYHLSAYRQQIATYYQALGITHTFAADPLPVIVNSLAPSLNSDGGTGSDTDNAAFVPSGCRPSQGIDKCLIFLRPSPSQAAICGPTTVKFYDLAREALVVVHEFQHYVTDSVAQLIPGSNGPNVGDAIHEGYSDYFAASQVSAVAGSNVTVVGQYAFQNCPGLQRDVSVPKVFVNDSSTTDPHVAGLTWASGLWQLRVLLGKKSADEMAYKSQFFLPALPGFIDVVEALVQADVALNQGANTATIRTLFYDQLQFVGGHTDVFRDSAKQIAEVGFESCAGAAVERLHAPRWKISFLLSLLVLLAWMGGTLFFGRFLRRGLP